MATKKDRKTMKRDGLGASGSDVQKVAELEACQRLLEAGAIGARIYDGPNIAGAFYTCQDKLLSEVKWVAVDVYEQKKLTVAHCRFVSNMIRNYWSERSRGSLSGAASMVQSYWVSVAKEIRVPLPMNYKQGATFKLNTLQSLRASGSPRSSLTVPPSVNGTPGATVVMNGLVTPPNGIEEPAGGPAVGNKKLLSHGLVHDWLNERVKHNPPLAEGTTGLADFCVQVFKHHLREDHMHHHGGTPRSSILQRQMSSSLSPSASAMHLSDSSTVAPSTAPSTVEDDFLLPVDPFLGEEWDHKRASLAAIESAVQQNLSKQGIDGLRCTEGLMAIDPSSFDNSRLLGPASVDAHKSVLQEIVCTNIMSRNPQLFALAANLAASLDTDATGRKLPVTALDTKRRRSGTGVEDQPNGSSAMVHKHYFVSVIFSTFTPREWEAVEDATLREALKLVHFSNEAQYVDWDLIASTVNWRMRAWLGYDLMRTGPQCKDRWRALPPANAVLTGDEGSKRKKVANTVDVAPEFYPLKLVRRKAKSRLWTCESVDSKSSLQEESEEMSVSRHPFMLSKEGSHSPDLRKIPFERRGVYSLAKPTTSFHTKAFSHSPWRWPCTVTARGGVTNHRRSMAYAWSARAIQVGHSSRPTVSAGGLASIISGREPYGSTALSHVALIDEARHEEIEYAFSIGLKVMTACNRAEAPKRAFSVEDMIRKNSAAAPGQVPQYISGQLVCPQHPSFSNMGRIAEMTLGRLLQSVNAGDPSAPPQTLPVVPVSVDTLFHYCTLFRKKYPAVFTSQHKVTKPSMPQLRPGLNLAGTTKMVTRQQASAVASRQHMTQVPSANPTPAPVAPLPANVVPSATPSVPATPPEARAAPSAAAGPLAAAGPGGNWLRTRQRRSNAPSRAATSPAEESQDPMFMAAGGPSLYGQFPNRQRGGR